MRHLQGLLIGRMQSLGFQLRAEAALQALTQDVVKTSEIEGGNLDTRKVRSSIARRMGVDIGDLAEREILLRQEVAGRSTRCELVLPQK